MALVSCCLEQSSFWPEPYLPEVFRIYVWWEVPWRQTPAFIRSYPCPKWYVLFSANTVTRPRNTRCTELHLIRERPYGVGEPRLLVVSSKLLFLRWCSLWENRQTSSVLNEREAGFNEQNVSRFAIVPKRFYGRSKQSCRKIRRTENIAQHSLTSLSRA